MNIYDVARHLPPPGGVWDCVGDWGEYVGGIIASVSGADDRHVSLAGVKIKKTDESEEEICFLCVFISGTVLEVLRREVLGFGFMSRVSSDDFGSVFRCVYSYDFEFDVKDAHFLAHSERAAFLYMLNEFDASTIPNDEMLSEIRSC
jgi:hypothetical protein